MILSEGTRDGINFLKMDRQLLQEAGPTGKIGTNELLGVQGREQEGDKKYQLTSAGGSAPQDFS